MQQPEHDLRPFQASIASPRRYVSLALVAALHVVVIWAFASGFAAAVVKKGVDELKTEVVKEAPPDQPKAPPPPPPDLAKPPPPFVPPPDINIASEAPSTTAISSVQSRRPAPPPPAKIVPPRAYGRTHTTPEYPPISRRLGEQGTVLLKIVIDANGDVTDASVEKSSGYSRLDSAAVSWVKRHWRYHPATQNGKPIAITTRAKVRFDLRQ